MYRDAQLSIDLIEPDGSSSYAVFSVGTGAIEKADQYGGEYDRPVFGINHGQAIADVQAAWGPGEPPDPRDPPHRRYPAKLTTSTGTSIDADVFYHDDKRGVFHVSFSKSTGGPRAR